MSSNLKLSLNVSLAKSVHVQASFGPFAKLRLETVLRGFSELPSRFEKHQKLAKAHAAPSRGAFRSPQLSGHYVEWLGLTLVPYVVLAHVAGSVQSGIDWDCRAAPEPCETEP